MRQISDTAEYGDYTGGARVITEETRKVLRQILKEIQDGSFAAGWIGETKTGRAWFEATQAEERRHPLEIVGSQLRGMMPFLQQVRMGIAQ